MSIEHVLQQNISKAIEALYGAAVDAASIKLETTNADFEGDYTFVVFPYLRTSKKNPEQTATDIGSFLKENCAEVGDFNVVKGFLNLVISQNHWLTTFYSTIATNTDFGRTAAGKGHKVMVEYSSPNTNKPLHLGHIRNNLLGYSVSQILEFNGYEVVKANLINDRGIHICKSMLAWQKFGNGETPQSSGLKGDHLVGKYYVEFDKAFKKQLKAIEEKVYQDDYSLILSEINQQKINELKAAKYNYQAKWETEDEKLQAITFNEWFGETEKLKAEPNHTWKNILKAFEEVIYNLDAKVKEKKRKELVDIIGNCIALEEKINELKSEIADICGKYTELLKEAQEMLRKWEAGDEEVINLWKTMNGWVYEGFDATYKRLGVSFDKFYYESQTYLLGKEIVQEGLDKGVFYRQEDSSVWIDLTAENLDKKLLLRRDGTSVYMTQDLGTADKKYEEYGCDKSVYVVGNEQDYHFKVLFSILKKMGKSYADGLFHLSYGMVDLPSGKMKSREGTVVDADELMDEMHSTARELTMELGKIEGFNDEEQAELFETLGLGALKYFLLRVDPVKRLLFDPKESIDFAGNTGPFIQYTHARITSLLKNIEESGFKAGTDMPANILSHERDMIVWLAQFPKVVEDAGRDYNPALIAAYTYDLAKLYNRFYHDSPVNKEPDAVLKSFRVLLTQATGRVLNQGLRLLGIKAPERM
jgi:arginyl-tRNA synthetase